MNIEEVREACLAINTHVAEGLPFAKMGHPDIAFTIAGKIFAFLCVPDSPSAKHSNDVELLVLKSDPDKAIELREAYPNIIEPAWHWNKKYWIQVHYDKLSRATTIELINESFKLVATKLTKKLRTEIGLI